MIAGAVTVTHDQDQGERFSCPWCETKVIAVEGRDDARRFMEAHLDGHMLVGVPVTGVEANRLHPKPEAAA